MTDTIKNVLELMVIVPVALVLCVVFTALLWGLVMTIIRSFRK